MSKEVLDVINPVTTFISLVNNIDYKGEDDLIDTLVCNGICEDKRVKTSTRITGSEHCGDCIFGVTDNSVLAKRMGDVVSQLKLINLLEE